MRKKASKGERTSVITLWGHLVDVRRALLALALFLCMIGCIVMAGFVLFRASSDRSTDPYSLWGVLYRTLWLWPVALATECGYGCWMLVNTLN